MASTSPLPSPVPQGASSDPSLLRPVNDARRSSLPNRRRSSSSRRSSASQAAYLEEEREEEEEAEEEEEERKVPLEPPLSVPLDEELEEIVAARASGEHSLGGWHYAPLIVGIGPALGAILGGKADLWSDAILLLLSSFWLFQCLKIPNDIYHAARTRRILQDDQYAEEDGVSPDSPERRRRCQLAIVELQRTEVLALIGCVVSPVLGAYGLHWLQSNLHDGSRYLNRFNIRLFMMAAGIRPWVHLFKLIRRRTLLLQEDVHYPSAQVESMKRRINRLEADISALRKTAVSRSDVRSLRDGIDVPLSQISRSMRKYERKEENLRNLADDKFALVEGRLEDLLRECAINAELIENERLERERASSVGRNILEAFKYALGQQRSPSPSPSHRAYLTDGRSSSFAGITAPPRPDSPESSGGSGEGMPGRSASWSGRASSSDKARSTSRGRATSQSSEPSGVGRSSSTPEWYEQGVLYWAFLPLNVSNSMLRFAGEKLASKDAGSAAVSASSPVSPTDAVLSSYKDSGGIARRFSLSSRAAGIAASSTSRTFAQNPTLIREGSLSPPLYLNGNGNGTKGAARGTSPSPISAFTAGSRTTERQPQPSIHISSPPPRDNGRYTSAFLGNGAGGAGPGASNGNSLSGPGGGPLGQLSLNQSSSGGSGGAGNTGSSVSWRRSINQQAGGGGSGQRVVKV